MIATILIWLYIVVLALAYGLIGNALVSKLVTRSHDRRPPWLVTALLGLSLLGWLLTLLTLVIPLAVGSHAVAIGLAIVLLIVLRSSVRASAGLRSKGDGLAVALGSAAVVAATMLVLGSAVSFPDHYDSGLYHAQSIRWIDEYPAVPGIVNLHPRLAFNSSWHVLESFSGLSFLDPGGFRPLNALLLMVTASAGLLSIVSLARGDVRPSRLMSAAMFPLSIYFFLRHIASPVTDTPTTLILWLLWVAVTDYLERVDRPRIDAESATLVIIAFFLVTVKLSAFPAVLVAMVALGRPWRWPRPAVIGLAAIATVMLTPWVIRSVIMSGTLAFPIGAIGPLPVEWAVSQGLAEREELITRAWARIPVRDAAEVMALSVSAWVPPWWSSIGIQLQVLLAVLILGPIVLALLLPRSLAPYQSTIRFPRSYAALVVVGYLGAFVWFSSAPDPRFGLGTLVPLALMLIVPLLAAVHRFAPIAVRAVLVVALVIPVRGAVADGLESIAQPERIVKPAPYYAAQTRLMTTNGFPVLVSTGTDQCWNAPLPCTPTLNPGLILRGCTLDAGFRISAAPELERPTDCAPLSSVQGRSRVPEILTAPRIERVMMRRRNQEAGPDMDCDAERQHDIRVLVRNRGAPATDASIVFELDDALVARQAIGALGTDEERWIDAGVTPRPPRGDRVLRIRVMSVDEQIDDERRVDVRCT